MLKSIAFLNNVTAAGLLARAALSLANDDLGIAENATREDSLVTEVLSEARDRIGLTQDDYSPDAIERLGDFLDAESDKILGPVDTDAALKRLAEKGELPHDLYEIRMLDIVFEGRERYRELEEKLIETTIRYPQSEQHYGRQRSNREPVLVSIFVRTFRTKYPFKDFIMMVAAARDNLLLDVHQAWRIYPSLVDTRGASDPVALLNLFADTYGFEVRAGDQKGHFFLTLEDQAPATVQVEFTHGESGSVIVSQFRQAPQPGRSVTSALVVAIDRLRYDNVIAKMTVKPSDILDDAFHAASAETQSSN